MFVEFCKSLFSLLGSLAWPTLVLYLVISFKREIRGLIDRLKTAELAGAKFTLTETASKLIEENLEELVEQPDIKERARLAGEIKKAATLLESIHPISLSILIQGVMHLIDKDQPITMFTWEFYSEMKKYFDELQKSNLTRCTTKFVHQENPLESG